MTTGPLTDDALDRALAAWAAAPEPLEARADAVAAAALAAVAAGRRSRPWLRPALGMALAASFAGALAFWPAGPVAPGAGPAPVATVASADPPAGLAAFELLFTPTPEEEEDYL